MVTKNLLRLLVPALLLTLSACGDGADEPAQAPARAPKAAAESNPPHLSSAADIPASKPWRIAYVMKSGEQGNPYWQRVAAGARAGGEAFGVRLELMIPHQELYDVSLQAALVEKLTADPSVDGLIIAPIDSQLLVAPVEAFAASGRPVVVHDTPLNARSPLTQLSFDNRRAGRQVGRWVAERLTGGGKALILEGQQESQNAAERRDGFIEGLAEGDVEILEMRTAGWRREEARRLTAQWLESYDEIGAILAANDAMAMGAAEAVEAAGRQGILITGVDANGEALEAIRAGRMHATVDQAPGRQARQAVQLVIRHLERGERYPRFSTWRESPLITADNVDAFLGAASATGNP